MSSSTNKLNEDSLLIATAQGHGRTIPYVSHDGTAACICYEPGEDVVLLVRQHRPVVGRETLEIPSGLLEPGEDPWETAKRETLEEAGVLVEDLHSLGPGLSSVGMTDEVIHLFWTQQWSRPKSEVAELDWLWVPLDSATQEIQKSGGDLKSMCAVLLLMRELGKI